jgi:hypothetical protein
VIIRDFKSIKELDDGGLSDCGIIYYKRTIIIFAIPEEVTNRTLKAAKAAVINESVSKGTKDGNIVHPSAYDSFLIRTNVYFCHVLFEQPCNVYLAQYRVESAYSKEHHAFLSSGNVAHYNIGHYSEQLGELENKNVYLYNEIVANMDVVVIPPIYYTEMHQYRHTSDLFCIGSALEIYGGKELIDNKTTFQFIDIELWDTIKYSIFNVLDNVIDQAPNAFNLSDYLNGTFNNFIGKDAYFIYDSDAKGMNRAGLNVVNLGIPFADFYPRKYIPENIKTALTLFENDCRDIEKEYGHIRLYSRPSNIGNKIKIQFKDYNDVPPGFDPVNNDYAAHKRSISVDHGFNVNREISEVINLLSDEIQYNNAEFE